MKPDLKNNLIRLFGVSLYVGMMAVGYYYNLTFVQLGLIDLGERVIGMSRVAVASNMAAMALMTSLIALAFGTWISRRGLGFFAKLRIAFLVILVQTILTPLAPNLNSSGAFLAWVIGCSFALGVGVPVTFGMAVDLVPVGWRGEAAAAITALAYLAANLVPSAWTIEAFTQPLMWVMPAGVIGLGVLAFAPLPFMDQLAQQHTIPTFSLGRYSRSATVRMVVLILLMFGVFFVDSLGFLRLLETPRFMINAWQSPQLSERLVIAAVHVIAALVGGILYDALDVRELFLWIFGIFALTHLLYTFSIRISATSAPLVQPMLYAIAVSLYTVVNFALWTDLSTPRTIGRNSALGVALSGWTATFLSTALAIWWQTRGMTLERHLNIVDSLAMLFFLAMIVTAFLGGKHPEGAQQ